MKHFILSLVALFLTIGCIAQTNDVTEAQNLAQRLSPRLAEKVVFQKIKTLLRKLPALFDVVRRRG